MAAAASAADTNSEINRKYEELRNIGNELAVLTGREPKFGRKREKESENDSGEQAPKTLSESRRITMDSDTVKEAKRPRLIYDIPARRNTDEKGDFPPLRKPTVQSSVRMPTIETKSRDQTIAEQKKQQKMEDGKRNRRMFGNLLGTLKQFQKEELKPALKQAEKLKEVEERLEKTSREEKEKFLNDKRTYEQKMREKEDEIKRLKQKRAIQIKGEIKLAHYKRLQKYIQTETKPAIFFLPATHTLRSMELLKKSANNMDGLIKQREEEMETELRELDELSDGEIAPTVRSSVKVASNVVSSSRFKSVEDNGELDDDFEDSDEDDRIRVRSSVVVKGEKVEDTKENNKVSEEKQENETAEAEQEKEAKNEVKEES